jgi:ribose transport system ATP-binding protein
VTVVDAQPALELRGVSMHFGGVYALNEVDFEVAPGEVHALLGQNGSGKSTLIKIITGYHTPNAGSMRAWGQDVPLPVRHPHDHGIAVIHQDLALVDGISVSDNIGLSVGFGTKLVRSVPRRGERARNQAVLDALGLDVRLDADVATLSAAERSGVAIARAMRTLRERDERHIFILDEPTASLSDAEAQRVVRLMRSVAEQQASVVFISHRLQEVLEVADRVTVLRDGRRVATGPARDATADSLVADMLGRALESYYPDKSDAVTDSVLLELRGVAGPGVASADVRVHEGEVVGLTGLAGMGHDEIPYLVAGAKRLRAGAMTVAGENIAGLGLAELAARGVALVPANRQRDGGWLAATAEENITLPQLRRYFSRGLLRRGRERRDSRSLMERLGVRPPDPTRELASFSGGNQQKVVLAKWLAMKPRLLALDEPTQGVDAGAKREILELVVGCAREQGGVLLASGDYEQLANVCNRVYVFYRGRVVAQLVGDQITEDALLVAAQAVGGGEDAQVVTTETMTAREHT